MTRPFRLRVIVGSHLEPLCGSVLTHLATAVFVRRSGNWCMERGEKVFHPLPKDRKDLADRSGF